MEAAHFHQKREDVTAFVSVAFEKAHLVTRQLTVVDPQWTFSDVLRKSMKAGARLSMHGAEVCVFVYPSSRERQEDGTRAGLDQLVLPYLKAGNFIHYYLVSSTKHAPRPDAQAYPIHRGGEPIERSERPVTNPKCNCASNIQYAMQGLQSEREPPRCRAHEDRLRECFEPEELVDLSEWKILLQEPECDEEGSIFSDLSLSFALDNEKHLMERQRQRVSLLRRITVLPRPFEAAPGNNLKLCHLVFNALMQDLRNLNLGLPSDELIKYHKKSYTYASEHLEHKFCYRKIRSGWEANVQDKIELAPAERWRQRESDSEHKRGRSYLNLSRELHDENVYLLLLKSIKAHQLCVQRAGQRPSKVALRQNDVCTNIAIARGFLPNTAVSFDKFAVKNGSLAHIADKLGNDWKGPMLHFESSRTGSLLLRALSELIIVVNGFRAHSGVRQNTIPNIFARYFCLPEHFEIHCVEAKYEIVGVTCKCGNRHKFDNIANENLYASDLTRKRDLGRRYSDDYGRASHLYSTDLNLELGRPDRRSSLHLVGGAGVAAQQDEKICRCKSRVSYESVLQQAQKVRKLLRRSMETWVISDQWLQFLRLVAEFVRAVEDIACAKDREQLDGPTQIWGPDELRRGEYIEYKNAMNMRLSEIYRQDVDRRNAQEAKIKESQARSKHFRNMNKFSHI